MVDVWLLILIQQQTENEHNSQMWVLVEGILMNQIVNEGYTYQVEKQFVRFAGFSYGAATFIALVGVIVMTVTSTYVNEAQDM